jgi:hypothetical protein
VRRLQYRCVRGCSSLIKGGGGRDSLADHLAAEALPPVAAEALPLVAPEALPPVASEALPADAFAGAATAIADAALGVDVNTRNIEATTAVMVSGFKFELGVHQVVQQQ